MDYQIIFSIAFIHGLTSTLHCVAMCGPFVGTINMNSNSKFMSNILYNIGRLFSYTLIGFLLGFLGSKLNYFGNFVQIQKISALLSGIFVIGVGIGLIFNRKLLNNNFTSNFIVKLFSPIIRYTSQYSWLTSFLIGLFTGLLPCGILYPAFAISFAAGNPLQGSISMVSFFLGTLPGMFFFGIGFHQIRLWLKPKLISTIGILLVIIGLSTIFIRFNHDHHEDHKPSIPHDHSQHR